MDVKVNKNFMTKYMKDSVSKNAPGKVINIQQEYFLNTENIFQYNPKYNLLDNLLLCFEMLIKQKFMLAKMRYLVVKKL